MLRGIVYGLAALLALACGLAAVGVRAQDPVDPLTLELQSSRNLCTAGTLTEVSWQIAGGTPPYMLSVEGETVNADAESHRINCGALTEAEATDENAALTAKQITATVTDSRGIQRKASLDVARARALPPLLSADGYGNAVSAYRAAMGFQWRAPATSYSCRDPNCFAIRWRAVNTFSPEAWTYAPLTHHLGQRALAFGIVRGLADGVAYEAAGAAMRHPLELETPEALRWTVPLEGTTLTNPTGLTATATHDTVTVRWNRQPSARSWSVLLYGPAGALGRHVKSWDATSWGDPATGVHEVVFRHLPSATRYEVLVKWSAMEGYAKTSAETSVETLALPAGHEPLQRGAQNLRATATHDSITVAWDQPFAQARDRYWVYLFHPDYYRARRVTVWHPNTQFTFTGLKSGVTYRIDVLHMAIVRASAEISVTTSAAPNEDGASGASDTARPRSADDSPPLHLTLESSRELCTAGTPTKISWEIAGGTPPYTLSVEGETVDADADNVRVICGARAEPPAADDDALEPKRVTATVTDSRGVQRQASLDVARARPLPAPTATARVWPNPNAIGFEWPGARGSAPCDVEEPFAVRWRRRGATEWSHNLYQSSSHDTCKVRLPIRGLEEGVAYEASIAALRDPIELNNPEALQWTRAAQGTTVTTPSGVTVNATHNSVTVRWNQQPSAYWYTVSLAGPNGGLGTQLARDLNEFAWRATANGIHEVVFRHLPPATAFTVYVGIPTDVHDKRLSTKTQVQTKAAPADWTPLPRGAQNVRASATADSITVRWDAPFVGADDRYKVVVYHPRYPSKPLFKWVYRNEFSQGGLEPGVTYRVIIEHGGVVKAPKEIQVTTIAETPGKARQAPPPFEWWANGRPTTPLLYLQLTSSRELCTAGTLTEISWQIAGGVPPYTLSIEGETVDADAESHRINCGALTEAEAADADAVLAAKRVTATVTDSRGVQRQASRDVARTRPLPPPVATASAWPVAADALVFSWHGARGQQPCASDAPFAMRWRRQGTSAWNHTLANASDPSDCDVWKAAEDLQEGVTYEAALAALRHPIELETPDALRWTAAVQATAITTPSGITASATHDTITVRWNRQPSAIGYHVGLSSPNGGTSVYLSHNDESAWADGTSETHEFTFRNLPSDTPFTAGVTIPTPVELPRRLNAKTQVRTAALPAGAQRLPRGPQNLHATATAESITVRWASPFAEAAVAYKLTIYHPRYPSKLLIDWVYTNKFSLSDLESGVTYRVVVEHQGIVRSAIEIQVTTIAETPSKARQAPPPFEWWAYGKPATPPLYLQLTSSRELCTAGTLTEISWTVSGGVPPYSLTIEDAAVDAQADNIRINCGALPYDPRTGELAASRTKTFQGSLRDSRGVTTTATALVTVITPPYLAADTALRYETYDLTGTAASAGSYAFLTDTTGAASVVTNYEGLRDGSAGALLVHTSDAQGTRQRSLYAAVAAGDLFEWRESYDCWVRYRVTEVRPDPSGAAARKLLGVEWTTYAFTGCSGAIATDAAVLLAWGPLPDLGGPSLAAPLRHGPYQLIPTGWRGVTEEPRSYLPSAYSATNPTYTRDLAAARRLPYWRDPDLPAGWTFAWATAGDVSGPTYGYWATFASERGGYGVTIEGYYADYRGHPEESSWLNARGALETRIIAGRPATVAYSPPGPNHDDLFAVTVWIYDSSTEAEYMILGEVKSLRGSNVDAVVAIARSLFEETDAP